MKASEEQLETKELTVQIPVHLMPIPEDILFCSEMSCEARLVWCIIFSMDDRADGWSKVSDKYLARCVGISTKQIEYRIRELADSGLLRIKEGEGEGETRIARRLLPIFFVEGEARTMSC